MAEGRQLNALNYGRIFICAVSLVLNCNYLFGGEPEGNAELEHYRVFSLRNISAGQGKKYLAEIGIGTVSQLPGSNALLVTAQPRELIKASAILKLVDSNEQFVIKVIFPASQAKNLPSNEQIGAEIGDISIGGFSAPPSGIKKRKAIIDIHKDSVIAIAAAAEIEKIVSAIERLKDAKSGVLEPNKPGKSGEPNQAGVTGSEGVKTEVEDNESGELFGMLTEAEKMAVETRPAATERPVVTKRQPGEQPKEPNLPAVVADAPELRQRSIEKPQTGDVAEKGKLVKADEPAAKKPVSKGQQEREAAEPVAAGPYEPQAVLYGDETLELNLPDQLNIVELFDLVGKYLHLNYMYDSKTITGEVTLRLQGPIKVSELYPLLESVLKFRGFAMTRKGNLVTVVPVADAVNYDPALRTGEGSVQLGDVVMTRIFELKHIDTSSAQNLLVGMKLGASITPIADTKTLIVTDYTYRMARIEELLDMIDRPGEPKQFRFRQLRYTMAKTLAPKIKTLAEQLGAISVSIAAPAAGEPAKPARGRPTPRTAPTPAAPVPTTQSAVYLDADERTNRIMMIGLEEQLVIVDELIDALDVEQQDLRTLRLYEIQNVGAEEVKTKLGELGIISGGVRPATAETSSARTTPATRTGRTAATAPAAGTTAGAATTEPLVEEPQVVIVTATNSLLVNATEEQHIQIAVIISYVDSETIEQAIPYEIYALENQKPTDLAEVLNKLIQETIKDKEGKIEKVVKRGEEEIIIVPDENTFSIIVYASRKNQEWVKKLIKDLDKRRPQVLIDVSLVEITRNDKFQYDLDIISNTEHNVTSNVAIRDTGKPYSVTKNPDVEARFNSVSTTTQAIQGFFSTDKVQAILTAIDSKSYGRILAKPKVLVNDNEKGTINTVATTYIATENVIIPSQTTTGGQQVSTYTTKDYKSYDAKIELVITPHISEGDLLRLEVTMTREDFSTASQDATKPPDKTTSKVETIVTVPDGFTIILGGLTKLNQAKGASKIPLLGDIPIVGVLFRGVKSTADDRQLYVFVKANILRPDMTAAGLKQLREISEKNRAGFEEREAQFQKLEAIPGLKPKPVDPIHVLDRE